MITLGFQGYDAGILALFMLARYTGKLSGADHAGDLFRLATRRYPGIEGTAIAPDVRNIGPDARKILGNLIRTYNAIADDAPTGLAWEVSRNGRTLTVTHPSAAYARIREASQEGAERAAA